MKIEKLDSVEGGLVNVIIETPKGSRHKYDFEPEYQLFKLKKTLPLGTIFPFDFGFIPNTVGEDGDPLDVLVLMDEPAYPGILVACRLLGMLEATQRERDGSEMRNDRYVAVAERSVMYKSLKNIEDLNEDMVEEIQNFFIDYNKHAGKEFTPLKWLGANDAMKSVEKG